MDIRRELGNVYGYPFFNEVMFYTALTLIEQLKGMSLFESLVKFSAELNRICSALCAIHA